MKKLMAYYLISMIGILTIFYLLDYLKNYSYNLSLITSSFLTCILFIVIFKPNHSFGILGEVYKKVGVRK